MSNTTPPFQIWQEVYCPTVPTGDKTRRWFVSGLSCKFGYGFHGWDVILTQAIYGDYNYITFFGRCDCTTVTVRDDQIVLPETFLNLEKEKVAKEIAQLEEKLKLLKEKNNE